MHRCQNGYDVITRSQIPPTPEESVIRRLLSCFVLPAAIFADAEIAKALETQLRRPVAIARVDRQLFVANRDSGTISLVDIDRNRVAADFPIGQRISDLAVVDNGKFLVATDERRHELILICRDETGLRVLERLPVAHTPVSIAIAANRSLVAVTSLWARRVTFFEISYDDIADDRSLKLSLRAMIDLPFAPRRQHFHSDGKTLIVADAFGGRLGAIDVATGKLITIRTIEGHQIRGLATDYRRDELLISHQMLSGTTHTTQSRVFWGTLMGNRVMAVAFDEFSADGKPGVDMPLAEKPIGHWSLYPVGEPRAGAGDPGAMLVTPSGAIVICLSGVNQIGIMDSPTSEMTRIDVGRRPTALAIDEDAGRLFVVSTLGDSISVVDLAERRVETTISLGPQPELTLTERGEQLFFDASLSLDGWLSCNSCHVDGHTNGKLNDNLGDETFGAPKRVLSLLGSGDTGPWAWNGTQDLLNEQIRKSIQMTMHGGADENLSDEHLDALAAFVRNLEPPPAIDVARGTVDAAAVGRGRKLFDHYECSSCHFAPSYTSHANYDVGLNDENGVNEFNPPSLRGVSQRGPYFHDGRAATLREVLEKHRHPGGLELETDDIRDLLSFLNSI